MFRRNRDLPLDNAGTPVPTYHAVELLSAAHSHGNTLERVTAAKAQYASRHYLSVTALVSINEVNLR